MDEGTDNLWPSLVFIPPQSAYWKTIGVEPAHQPRVSARHPSTAFQRLGPFPPPHPCSKPTGILLASLQQPAVTWGRARGGSPRGVGGRPAITSVLEARASLLGLRSSRSFPGSCPGWRTADVRERKPQVTADEMGLALCNYLLARIFWAELAQAGSTPENGSKRQSFFPCSRSHATWSASSLGTRPPGCSYGPAGNLTWHAHFSVQQQKRMSEKAAREHLCPPANPACAISSSHLGRWRGEVLDLCQPACPGLTQQAFRRRQDNFRAIKQSASPHSLTSSSHFPGCKCVGKLCWKLRIYLRLATPPQPPVALLSSTHSVPRPWICIFHRTQLFLPGFCLAGLHG